MKRMSPLARVRTVLKSAITVSALSVVLLAEATLAQHTAQTSRQPNAPTIPTRFYAYNPPPGASRPQTGPGTTGVRLCGEGDSNLTLLALAPRDHVGKTALSHPTFVWYVPDTDEFFVEFRLYELKKSGSAPDEFEEVIEVPMVSTPGTMTFTLPPEHPGLKPGGDYVWQVKMICDENDTSAHTLAQADLSVISQVEGTTLNSGIADPGEAVDRYAQAGLWYDAIGLTALLPENEGLQGRQANLLRALAEVEASAAGGDASAEEEPMTVSGFPTFSEQLKLIADNASAGYTPPSASARPIFPTGGPR